MSSEPIEEINVTFVNQIQNSLTDILDYADEWELVDKQDEDKNSFGDAYAIFHRGQIGLRFSRERSFDSVDLGLLDDKLDINDESQWYTIETVVATFCWNKQNFQTLLANYQNYWCNFDPDNDPGEVQLIHYTTDESINLVNKYWNKIEANLQNCREELNVNRQSINQSFRSVLANFAEQFDKNSGEISH